MNAGDLRKPEREPERLSNFCQERPEAIAKAARTFKEPGFSLGHLFFDPLTSLMALQCPQQSYGTTITVHVQNMFKKKKKKEKKTLAYIRTVRTCWESLRGRQVHHTTVAGL